MKKFLFLALLHSNIVFCSEWETLIESHKHLMGEQAYQLIRKQYDAFVAGNAPKIVHPEVKSIPIIEEHEVLIHVDQGDNKRLKVLEGDLLLQAHTSPEDIDPRSDLYAFVRKGVYNALSRMIEELDRLAPHFGYKSGALEILLFEGTRDLATQKEIFDRNRHAIMAANPEMSYEQAYEQTCYWVSPYENNVPVHSTGAAVDIALYDNATKQFCSMGRFNTGGAGAPMLSYDAQVSSKQKKNRLLFLIAATRAGLTNYVYEFWHFSYNDRYALYWKMPSEGALYSPYGAIES